jgi:hypothetical protein
LIQSKSKYNFKVCYIWNISCSTITFIFHLSESLRAKNETTSRLTNLFCTCVTVADLGFWKGGGANVGKSHFSGLIRGSMKFIFGNFCWEKSKKISRRGTIAPPPPSWIRRCHKIWTSSFSLSHLNFVPTDIRYNICTRCLTKWWI